jgi:hypothetical protein
MKCCVVGIGNHCRKNLIPALQKLQNEKLIEIVYVCRKNIKNGDGGLNVPVINYYPKDVDLLVACGHPSLHKSVIDFSNENGIPCFVEKPHLITDQYVNNRVLIGYNFNFMSILPTISHIDGINCGTKGIYKSWPDIFNNKFEKYQHVFHSVIVHPISVIVQRYDMSNKIELIDNSDNDDNNHVDIKIIFYYDDLVKYINYSTEYDGFIFDIVHNDNTIKCKPYKPDSYYNMLKYYVKSGLNPKINNANTGKNTLDVINFCLQKIYKNA